MTPKEYRYHNFYMDIARNCASMSHALRKKVGAVIVRDDNIISYGWNGTPTGQANECEDKLYEADETKNVTCIFSDELRKERWPLEENVDGKYMRYRLMTKPTVLHAELNAICKLARTTGNSDGASLYVTLSPCPECAKLLIQAKIKKVFYLEKYRDTAGIDLLENSGISVIDLSTNYLSLVI